MNKKSKKSQSKVKVKNLYLDENEYPLNRLPKTAKGRFHLKSYSIVSILMNLEDGADPWIVLDHLIVANSIREKAIDDFIGALTIARLNANEVLGDCFKETNTRKSKQVNGNSNNPI